MLVYKVEWHGKQAIMILKTFTSPPIWSHCGNKNKDVKDLNLLEWNYPFCGMYHDRDVNTRKRYLLDIKIGLGYFALVFSAHRYSI